MGPLNSRQLPNECIPNRGSDVHLIEFRNVVLIPCHMILTELEFLTKVFLETTGQKLATLPISAQDG